MLPRVPLVPEELWVHPLGGGLAVALGLLDAVLVRLVRLVVRRVVLRLGHLRSLSLSLTPPASREVASTGGGV